MSPRLEPVERELHFSVDFNDTGGRRTTLVAREATAVRRLLRDPRFQPTEPPGPDFARGVWLGSTLPWKRLFPARCRGKLDPEDTGPVPEKLSAENATKSTPGGQR